jgi:hypothetical protein
MATIVSIVGCALIAAGLWGSISSLWRQGVR